MNARHYRLIKLSYFTLDRRRTSSVIERLSAGNHPPFELLDNYTLKFLDGDLWMGEILDDELVLVDHGQTDVNVTVMRERSSLARNCKIAASLVTDEDGLANEG